MQVLSCLVSLVYELEFGKSVQQVAKICFITAEPCRAVILMEKDFGSKWLLVITDGKWSLWHVIINSKKQCHLTARLYAQFKQLHTIAVIFDSISKEEEKFTAGWNNLPIQLSAAELKAKPQTGITKLCPPFQEDMIIPLWRHTWAARCCLPEVFFLLSLLF